MAFSETVPINVLSQIASPEVGWFRCKLLEQPHENSKSYLTRQGFPRWYKSCDPSPLQIAFMPQKSTLPVDKLILTHAPNSFFASPSK